jgi:multidrug efflux pump subunit AcrB
MVALTINPWVSFNITKDIKHNDINKTQIKESRFKLRKKYLNFLKIFLWSDRKTNIKRKIFKISFWLALFIIVLWPIYWWIFKARMLPKSNQDQIYLWIDAPRWWWIKKTQEVQDYVLQYLTLNEKTSLSNNQDIFNSIKNVTSTIWQSYIPEFANLFRWWLNRNLENQISLRINLFTQDEYKKLYWKGRIKSEEFTINLRPILKNKILEKYPDLKISLLEDPPWPPVRSTFLVKIKWDSSNENKKAFALKVENEIKKIALDQNITDLYNSNSSTYREIKIIFDHESISRAWLNIEQVSTTLGLIFEWSPISLITNMNSYEPTNIILVWNNEQISDINFLKSITFTNNYGQKISLDSISNIDYSFVSDVINTDNREDVIYITWEMWDNSLVYPVTKLIWIFSNKDFLWINYIIKNKTPYKIEYISLLDNKNYIIEWWWEWELTLDTFLDLGLAMWISLLLIYFVLVWQFASFQIAWIIMITFLLWFFWVFPWFSLLYLINGEYFSATSMIWVIALAWIVVWNAILLIDYIIIWKRNWLTIEDAILKAWYVRFTPIILTSMTTVFWAMTIIWDPVWSWLAWTIIWWLLVSSILTLIIIPIFYYDSQKKYWN